MSQENVEVVRSLYGLGGDAFLNAGADAADRAFRDHLDEQFEVRLPSDYPEGEPVFRGRAGARRDVRHARRYVGQVAV